MANVLQRFGKKGHKKFHLNVPAQDKTAGESKGDCHELGNHYDIDGAGNRQKKNLRSEYINTGNEHHKENSGKSDPLHQKT